jgi:hypothetical protein
MATIIPVLVRERCLGHVLERGREGFEAFNSAEQSLGIFASAATAVQELIDAASNPPEAA